MESATKLTDFCEFISFTPMIGMKKNDPPHVDRDRASTSRDTGREENNTEQMLLSSLFDALPTTTWDRNLAPGAGINRRTSSNSLSNNRLAASSNSSPSDFFGNSSSSSGSNSSINCGWCDVNALTRCIDCCEAICNECLQNTHRQSPVLAHHTVVTIYNGQPVTYNTHCDYHLEVYRYFCEYCKRLICQYCSMREHRDHCYQTLEYYCRTVPDKIEAALQSSTVGTKCVKGSIDKALSFSRAVERDAIEVTQAIHKSFRQYILAVEERERILLENVEKLRLKKQTLLSDQTAGLRSALAGLAQNTENLVKAAENYVYMDPIELTQIIIKSQNQLEQFASIFQNLQPKQEFLAFAPPSFAIVHEIRGQGDVVISDSKLPQANGCIVPSTSTSVIAARRAIVRDAIAPPPIPLAIQAAPHHHLDNGNLNITGGLPMLAPPQLPPSVVNNVIMRVGHCIPSSYERVVVRKSPAPTNTFGVDGHDDGQVSRPWGICVDKDGNILVSDRRNNRVQIFNPDGSFRMKFGCKGVGSGQFDLPAGICVDCDNRIIVVDKDNHRVQIFTNTGRFLLKFGCYGREYGQFQYPWDVAVNSRREIVVTDSRNHRLQQFDSEGRFIKHLIFDSLSHIKGPASPRGVCFTPGGDIIVSDFDNHCLLLVDSGVNQVLSIRGQEGAGIPEFNRPSGICCDDDGNIIVADSKNQRVLIFTDGLDHKWTIEIRPSLNPGIPSTLDEKDRPCDVAVLPNGNIAIMVELSPDARDSSNPLKTFVQIY